MNRLVLKEAGVCHSFCQINHKDCQSINTPGFYIPALIDLTFVSPGELSAFVHTAC